MIPLYALLAAAPTPPPAPPAQVGNNNNTTWVVLIVAVVASVIGPLLLAWLTGRQRRAEKIEDYRRQDEVAMRADEATRVLLESQERNALRADLLAKEAADRAEEVAQRLVDQHERTTEEMNGKLDVIHVLVNSNMTKAMQAELDATAAQLVLMREVIALREATGTPSPNAAGDIAAVESKIKRLAGVIAIRHQQTQEAEQLGYGR